MAKQSEIAVDTAAALEQLQKEETLRFGAEVTIRYEPKFPALDITAPDDFNYRLAVGQNVAGVELKHDKRNVIGMVDSVKTLNGITTPLVVSERNDGSFWLLQGYRRYNAAAFIRQTEPGTPLAERLKDLPCVVYKGLTLQQERELINDQKSKLYTNTEVFLMFKEQVDGGFGWENIARRMYHQIGQVTGRLDKVKEIDDITDQVKQREELIEWLTTTCQQFWWNAIKAGPITTDYTIRTFMYKDGYTTERPPVLMDSMRMRALQTTIRADRKAGEWDELKGRGPRFDKKLAELEEEDNKKYNKSTDGAEPVEKEPKLRSLKDYNELIRDAKRARKADDGLVERVLKIGFKEAGDPLALRLVHNFDRCLTAYKQHASFIKPELKSVFDMVFDGGEGTDEQFAAFLIDNYLETTKEDEATKEDETTKEENTTKKDVTDVMEAPKNPDGSRRKHHQKSGKR